jgi:hypothetical protein
MRVSIGKCVAESPAEVRARYKKLGRNAKKFARKELKWKVLLAPRKHRERRPRTGSVTLHSPESDRRGDTRPLQGVSHRVVHHKISRAQHAKAAAAVKKHNLAAAAVPEKLDPYTHLWHHPGFNPTFDYPPFLSDQEDSCDSNGLAAGGEEGEIISHPELLHDIPERGSVWGLQCSEDDFEDTSSSGQQAVIHYYPADPVSDWRLEYEGGICVDSWVSPHWESTCWGNASVCNY